MLGKRYKFRRTCRNFSCRILGTEKNHKANSQIRFLINDNNAINVGLDRNSFRVSDGPEEGKKKKTRITFSLPIMIANQKCSIS